MGGGQQGMIAAPVHVPHLLNACPERLAAVARTPRAIYAHRGECGSGDGGGRLGEGGTMATRFFARFFDFFTTLVLYYNSCHSALGNGVGTPSLFFFY